jgi:hypothetical protein
MIHNPRKPKTQNNSALNQAAKLQSMEKRLKKLTIRLWAVMFLLFIILSAGALLFANLYYEQLALALSSNYNKTSGDMLTANMWNNLTNDFVAKSGDTMSGDLSVAGDVSGNQLCISGNCKSSWSGLWCGLTGPGAASPMLCEGHNPENSCPSGYTQVAISVTSGTLCTSLFGCTTHYTCIKN